MGTPEYVVSDSLARLGKIVNLSRMSSCAVTRDAEISARKSHPTGLGSKGCLYRTLLHFGSSSSCFEAVCP